MIIVWVAVGPRVRGHRGRGVLLVRVMGDGLLVDEGGQRWRRPSWGQPVHVASWRGRASWRKLMVMDRHNAAAHAENGEGLNLCILLLLR